MIIESALTAAFGAGGGAVTLVSALAKLGEWHGKQKEMKRLQKVQDIQLYMQLLEAQATRELRHPALLYAGIISRGFMLLVSLSMLVLITWWGVFTGNVILYPETGEPWAVNILGLIEFSGSSSTRWQELPAFSIPVFPVWFAIIGAQVSFHLTQNIFWKK